MREYNHLGPVSALATSLQARFLFSSRGRPVTAQFLYMGTLILCTHRIHADQDWNMCSSGPAAHIARQSVRIYRLCLIICL